MSARTPEARQQIREEYESAMLQHAADYHLAGVAHRIPALLAALDEAEAGRMVALADLATGNDIVMRLQQERDEWKAQYEAAQHIINRESAEREASWDAITGLRKLFDDHRTKFDEIAKSTIPLVVRIRELERQVALQGEAKP